MGLAITTDEGGNVYLTGQTNGNLGDFTNKGGKDLFVVKYDDQGEQQWIHQSGTAQDDLGTEISVDALGRLNLLSLAATGDSVEQPQRFLNRFHPETGQPPGPNRWKIRTWNIRFLHWITQEMPSLRVRRWLIPINLDQTKFLNTARIHSSKSS